MKRDPRALEGSVFDVLVIGGGIVGAAAAWEAAQRGLSVALVEARDFGGGTSWNSLKTLHGGLRHLQRLDIPGLREGVRERRALLRIAPSCVRPLSFVVPAGAGGRAGGGLALAAGLRVYDLFSLDRNKGVPADRALARSRVLSREALSRLVPALDPPATSGVLWQDAQVVRSESLILGFLAAAAEAGAQIANYASASALLLENGRAAGARVRNEESGEESAVCARAVLGAAGHGLDALLRRSQLPPCGVPWLSAVNLVLRRPAPAGVALAGRSRGRYLFLVPWRGLTMVGTDYVSVASPPETPVPEAVSSARVAAFLKDAVDAFPWAGLRREDIVVVHHGFVPGAHANALWPHDKVFEHTRAGAGGVLSLVASKYTTARALAERAVDRVFDHLGRTRVPSRTASRSLPIADPEAALEEQVRRAVREQMALHLSDVVLRRTDLGTAGPPERDVIERVARVMAGELGWEKARIEAEVRALEAESCSP